jgi:hypothetical protein
MSARVVHVRDNVRGALYVGRQNTRLMLVRSPLANPFVIGREGNRKEVIERYRDWLNHEVLVRRNRTIIEALIHARGETLSCWCRHVGEERTGKNACHADVILEFLDRYSDDDLRAIAACHY